MFPIEVTDIDLSPSLGPLGAGGRRSAGDSRIRTLRSPELYAHGRNTDLRRAAAAAATTTATASARRGSFWQCPGSTAFSSHRTIVLQQQLLLMMKNERPRRLYEVCSSIHLRLMLLMTRSISNTLPHGTENLYDLRAEVGNQVRPVPQVGKVRLELLGQLAPVVE